MSLMFLGAALAVVSTFVAWAAFRKPGVAFWTFAPVWRANDYLFPIGAALWVGGCILGAISVGAYYLSQP